MLAPAKGPKQKTDTLNIAYTPRCERNSGSQAYFAGHYGPQKPLPTPERNAHRYWNPQDKGMYSPMDIDIGGACSV